MPNPNPVVSNTAPLISLGEVGLLDILHQLYGDVWIPQAVFDEYQIGIPALARRGFIFEPGGLTPGERQA